MQLWWCWTCPVTSCNTLVWATCLFSTLCVLAIWGLLLSSYTLTCPVHVEAVKESSWVDFFLNVWFASWFDIHAKLWEKPKTEYEGPSKICLHVRSLRVIIPKCRIAPNHGSKTMPKIMSSRRWLQNHAPWSGTREFCQCSFGEAKILTGPHIFYFYNIWYYIYLCTYVYMYIFVTCIFNITSSKFAGITVVFLHIAVHATFGNIDMWLIWRHRFGEFLFAPFFGPTGPRSWCFHIFFWLGQVAVWILQKAPILYPWLKPGPWIHLLALKNNWMVFVFSASHIGPY